MKYPSVVLNPGREQSILRRHQWIFSKAIKKKEPTIRDGDIVTVYDSHGNTIATGHYQDSSLSIRILDFAESQIDVSFWEKKIRNALAYRTSLGLTNSSLTTAYRLIHGEGDELPGLIVDIYHRTAVVQAHSIGMFRQRDEIASALMSIEDLHLEGVFDKSGDLGQYTGSGPDTGWLAGESASPVLISENDISYMVDFVNGQKTGFFLDQRENRKLVGAFASGKTVLNCFCYTGGFSLYALSAGAQHVTSIDSSHTAIELLNTNVRLGKAEHRHTSHCANVMEFLKSPPERYDLVICDPPAFAKSLHKRHNAIQAYKRLNVMAMQGVKKGGILFTFSCSQVVDRQLFHDTIVAAAIECGRSMRVVQELSQGPDHPVSIYHPEGSYLKGLALYLD